MAIQNMHKGKDENAVARELLFFLLPKNVFGEICNLGCLLILLSVFFNRKKRLNELHVGSLLGGGKERVGWVSVGRREEAESEIKKCCLC